MATSGTGAIVTEGEAYYCGHVYLSSSSKKALTYGKMVDNANVYYSSGSTTVRYFAGAWLTDAMRSTAGVTPPAINRYKCVKYTDIKTRSIRVPWYIVLRENIGLSASRANKVEFRYYYKTSSTATETYKVAGSWQHSSNVNGSVTMTYYVEANPYALYNGSVYSSRLVIWCGSCKVNQSWEYRLRTKSSPTSGTWGAWQVKSSNTVDCLAYPSGSYLSAMRDFNGVEFYVD